MTFSEKIKTTQLNLDKLLRKRRKRGATIKRSEYSPLGKELKVQADIVK